MTSAENTNSSEDSQSRGLRIELPTSYATYVDRWAIIVGISKYKHESLNLKYADRDAEELANLLQTPSGGGGGGMGRRSSSDDSKAVNRYLQEISQTTKGIALLTSAEAKEVSFEHEKWGGGHGVFTYFLLEGMRGAADNNQDGVVTIGELFEYVRENVKLSTEHKQHPCIGTTQFDRNLPIAISLQNQSFSALKKYAFSALEKR